LTPCRLSCLFLGGVFLSWAAAPCRADDLPPEIIRAREGGYRFVNPLLECEENRGRESVLLRPFKYKLEEYVNPRLSEGGGVTHISVYFRDLNNGPWLGIKFNEDFVPASLLKVPIMMTYFKRAESDPGVLQRRIKNEGIKEDYSEKQTVKPEERMRPGESYTVEDLIYRMIVYSDNNATVLLYRDGLLDKIYYDLGLVASGSRKPLERISVKEYASFFRILFNATYLTKPFSEKALEYLSRVRFKQGLPSGIPEGIPIAHKFGERNRKDEKQLHDCGIIYYPGHPYLLCVMTRGDNFDDLVGVIRGVSELVHKEVDGQYRDQTGIQPR
jgi:beta-lactamase class A